MRVFNRSQRDALRRIAVFVAICAIAFAIAWLQVQYWSGVDGDLPPFSAGSSATAATTSTGAETTPPASTMVGEAGATATASAIDAAPPQTPLPEETPATSEPCGQAVVGGVEVLAIRNAPGLGTEVIGSRPSGTVVELLCDAPAEVDGVTWRKVRTEGVEGWMSGRFLR